MDMNLWFFFYSFVTLFVIVDPVMNVPIFAALLDRTEKKEYERIVRKAVIIAAVVLIIFTYSGNLIFNLLGIEMYSFRIAGGILLFIISLEMLFGKRTKTKGNFEIKKGQAYYINEKKPRYSRKIFKQILDRGVEGLYISRDNPEGLEFYGHENADIYWLTSVKGEKRVDPRELTQLQTVILKFIRSHQKGVVVIEGLETMITNTGFIKVLQFLQRVRDIISENHGILIISIDLDTLNSQDRALIKREIINEIPIKKSH